VLKPHLHESTCCQTGCQTGLTTGFDNWLYCVYKHSTSCQTRFTTDLTTGCIVYTVGCQTSCTTRFDNWLNEQLFVQHGCQTGCQRFDNRLYHVNKHPTSCQSQTCLTTGFTTSWMFVYTIQPVVKLVVQPVVSCKRGIRDLFKNVDISSYLKYSFD